MQRGRCISSSMLGICHGTSHPARWLAMQTLAESRDWDLKVDRVRSRGNQRAVEVCCKDGSYEQDEVSTAVRRWYSLQVERFGSDCCPFTTRPPTSYSANESKDTSTAPIPPPIARWRSRNALSFLFHSFSFPSCYAYSLTSFTLPHTRLSTHRLRLIRDYQVELESVAGRVAKAEELYRHWTSLRWGKRWYD